MSNTPLQYTRITLRIAPHSEATLKSRIQEIIPSFQGVFPDVYLYTEADSLQIPTNKTIHTQFHFVSLHSLPDYEGNHVENAPDVCLGVILRESPSLTKFMRELMEQGATLLTTMLCAHYGAFQSKHIDWLKDAHTLESAVNNVPIEMHIIRIAVNPVF